MSAAVFVTIIVFLAAIAQFVTFWSWHQVQKLGDLDTTGYLKQRLPKPVLGYFYWWLQGYKINSIIRRPNRLPIDENLKAKLRRIKNTRLLIMLLIVAAFLALILSIPTFFHN